MSAPARLNRFRTCLLLACAVLASASPARAAATVLASTGDAHVTQDGSTWTIGTSTFVVTYTMAAGHQLTLQQIVNPETGRQWRITPGPDSAMAIADTNFTVSDANGFSFSSASAEVSNGGVRLTFLYTRSDLHLSVRRVYACVPGAPVVESWTRIESSSLTTPASIGGLTPLWLTVPAGTVHWVNGDQGDSASTENDQAFAMNERDLAAGEQVAPGSSRRSSEQFEPLVTIDGTADEFFIGTEWSGAWQIRVLRTGAALDVQLTHPGATTRVSDGHAFESPHAFFGVTPGGPGDVPAALRPFIDTSLRSGRALAPLVTYNTWYAHGTNIDEASIEAEIVRDAALGVELFVVDAGWYAGAGADNQFDYESGLGSWQPDPDRFPNGLRPLRDLAHSLGMKFGIWVEPERVALSTVGEGGLAEEGWLATVDGSYGSDTAAQICLGHAAARAWVQQQLFALIDDVQPDYVKWDNNFWVNCNRASHDHGTNDGNFAHVQGLYSLLQALRDRYPDLLIEDCASGGNRLDFGWLRYSDAAWMDDRTSPSSHVRHNLEGLSSIFPPAYLLSFLIDHQTESIFAGDDVILYLRSRMPGVFGMSFDGPGVPDRAASSIAAGIRDYKALRDVVSDGQAETLTAQADPANDYDWDVVQEVNPSSGDALIFAYQGPSGADKVTVTPRGLVAAATYDVTSLDAGPIGTATGSELMTDGIDIEAGTVSRAHVLVLRVQP